MLLGNGRTAIDKRVGLSGIGWRALAMIGVCLAVVAPSAIGTATGAAAPLTTSTSTLRPGATLLDGHSLVSNNRLYQLAMQRDGNLVLYKGRSATWAANTEGHAGARAVMQRDGNLVVYLGQRAIWSSRTDRAGDSGSSLVVQDDGNLVVYSASNRPLWWTYRPPSGLRPGAVLASGAALTSRNGAYRLVMQRDGNLVLYRTTHALWAAEPTKSAGAFAVMQRDGNLVMYVGNRAVWSSRTDAAGDAGSSLVVQDDGNVVIYAPSNKPLWSTFPPLPTLALGDYGAAVLTLQRRLANLGYWLGQPGGVFGDATQQAVFAVQKAAGLNRTGVVDSTTWKAINAGVEPTPRPAAGDLIEVNLTTDLLMVMRGGKLWATLNTSTGGGYTYVSQGVTSVAITPHGVFHIYSVIDGVDVAPLGVLWRPRFFTGGYAIHGDSYVPAYPVSHGCVRVSDEAIDWIWADNVAPLGTEVWIY
jgi:peptidoglycan hydrolase-like protein with peptidoglycan-binding domain